MYDAVRSLLRVLDDGAAAKARLDKVIDYCSQMQNLREAISAYRSRMFKEQVRSWHPLGRCHTLCVDVPGRRLGIRGTVSCRRPSIRGTISSTSKSSTWSGITSW